MPVLTAVCDVKFHTPTPICQLTQLTKSYHSKCDVTSDGYDCQFRPVLCKFSFDVFLCISKKKSIFFSFKRHVKFVIYLSNVFNCTMKISRYIIVFFLFCRYYKMKDGESPENLEGRRQRARDRRVYFLNLYNFIHNFYWTSELFINSLPEFTYGKSQSR